MLFLPFVRFFTVVHFVAGHCKLKYEFPEAQSGRMNHAVSLGFVIRLVANQ